MSEYYDDSIYETVGTGEAAQEETHRDIPADMPPVDQPKKPHKKNGGKKGVALALVCALLGGGMGIGGAFLGASLARGDLPQTVVSGDGVSTVMQGVRETSVLQIQQIDSSKELTAAEVYAANVNSTVGIVTSAVTTNFWGQQTQSAAAGSGFIFTDDGYIITNYHVIEGANTVTVSTYDGTQYDAKIIGYDLKEDVVEHCNEVAARYGYDGLRFVVADVTRDVLYDEHIDMLVTLHACDTATDYALHYAISRGVEHIFSVPCCQHEVNKTIQKGGDFDILLSHGLFQERFSALLTDAIRAAVLEDEGYDVDVIEFIDFAHSPKNLMLRCHRTGHRGTKKLTESRRLRDQYGFEQTLLSLVENDRK